MPSSSVFAPPIRRTKTSPSMSTLKLRLVIPPPSSDTVAERRPRSSRRDAGGAGAARARDPHLLPGRPLRVIPPTRRAAVRGGADRRREEGGLLLDRRRGDRERCQDRALGDEPPRRDQLPWRVPRPHAARAQPHRQRPALQAGLWSLRGRDLSDALSL